MVGCLRVVNLVKFSQAVLKIWCSTFRMRAQRERDTDAYIETHRHTENRVYSMAAINETVELQQEDRSA